MEKVITGLYGESARYGYGICDAENVASCRGLEKCGFSLENQGAGKYQGKQNQIKKYVYGKFS